MEQKKQFVISHSFLNILEKSREEAIDYMKGLRPFKPSIAVIIGSAFDAYVSNEA